MSASRFRSLAPLLRRPAPARALVRTYASVQDPPKQPPPGKSPPSASRGAALDLDDLFAAFTAPAASTLSPAEQAKLDRLSTPLFRCAVSFPQLSTDLTIFEPRYKLMMARVQSSDGMFGMLLPKLKRNSQSKETDEEVEYGTMLHIKEVTPIGQTGTSLVSSIGVYRFRVLEQGTRDKYTVGRVERLEDLSPAEEIEREKADLALADSSETQLVKHRSTADLMTACTTFVTFLQTEFGAKLEEALGAMPTKPSELGYWMAQFLPIDDYLKMELLKIDSSRQRLVVVVGWLEMLEASMKAQEAKAL